MTAKATIADWVETRARGIEYGYFVHDSPLMQPRRRTIRIDRAPPRRVLAGLRYRSFKTGPDRDIWQACWEPVRRLLDDGWRIVGVTVDWGRYVPMSESWRLEMMYELTGCYARERVGDTGRGSVIVDLVHD